MEAVEVAFSGVQGCLALLARGELSARELVELYLTRIERFNPVLNAFRVVFGERALLEATQADARRRAGEAAQRPLLGVPIAVKEDIDVAGALTTFGTRAVRTPAAQDAEIVRRLREAGAIVIGKTNVPELCAYPWTETPTYGATRNPWDLDRTPGGSSGGSAAAVAAGLVPAALGSDGGGSIRYPAAFCGLVGLKCQRGRLPLAPHLDACQGLSVNGALTRTVGDAALLYDILADGPPDPGVDPLPPLRLREALQTPVARLRIGVAANLPPGAPLKLAPANRAAFEESAELLREAGHHLERCDLPHGPISPTPEFTVRFLWGLRDDGVALERPDLLERRLRTALRIVGRLGERAVRWARAREGAYRAHFSALFQRFDLLLTPVTPTPPPPIGRCEGRGWLYTTLYAGAIVPYAAHWNVTGQPAVAVPAGFDRHGVPRAIQLVAPPLREDLLIVVARELEERQGWAEQPPPLFAS